MPEKIDPMSVFINRRAFRAAANLPDVEAEFWGTPSANRILRSAISCLCLPRNMTEPAQYPSTVAR